MTLNALSLAERVYDSPCASCTSCLNTSLGRHRNHPCHQVLPLAENPKYFHPNRMTWTLRRVLNAAVPKVVFEEWRKKIARENYPKVKKLLERPKIKDKHKLLKRISYTNSPWYFCKKVPKTKAYQLESISPRITTAAHHGTQVLLRPLMDPLGAKLPPEDFKGVVEEVILDLQNNPTRFDGIVAEERSIRLAKKHRQIGNRTLKSLEGLEAPEVSEDLEDLEPLRAMSLKEVTNFSLLKKTEGTEGLQGLQGPQGAQEILYYPEDDYTVIPYEEED